VISLFQSAVQGNSAGSLFIKSEKSAQVRKVSRKIPTLTPICSVFKVLISESTQEPEEPHSNLTMRTLCAHFYHCTNRKQFKANKEATHGYEGDGFAAPFDAVRVIYVQTQQKKHAPAYSETGHQDEVDQPGT
jgi:hypothetical protein